MLKDGTTVIVAYDEEPANGMRRKAACGTE